MCSIDKTIIHLWQQGLIILHPTYFRLPFEMHTWQAFFALETTVTYCMYHSGTIYFNMNVFYIILIYYLIIFLHDLKAEIRQIGFESKGDANHESAFRHVIDLHRQVNR